MNPKSSLLMLSSVKERRSSTTNTMNVSFIRISRIIYICVYLSGSLDFYNRALAVILGTSSSDKGKNSDSDDVKNEAIIWLNMAAAFLALDRLEEAYEAAKKALECGADKAKSLFRFDSILFTAITC
jgi:tetratricopeptide (TPR) repeat protein